MVWKAPHPNKSFFLKAINNNEKFLSVMRQVIPPHPCKETDLTLQTAFKKLHQHQEICRSHLVFHPSKTIPNSKSNFQICPRLIAIQAASATVLTNTI